MNIGISGFGFVGSAIYSNIIDKSSVKIYDPKFSEYNEQSSLLDSDVVFICVNTPLKINNEFKPELDNSMVIQNLKFLKENEYTGLVVIKSTIHPTYIKPKYLEGLNILSNPEFLDENNSIKDFKNQKINIIGGRIDLAYKLKSVYDNDFNLNCEYEFVSFEEALIFKYIRNIKIAYDVMFWEFVDETTGNYRKYNNIMRKLPVTVKTIRTDGKPGFGGHCLPKDNASYPEHKLTNFLSDYNNMIRNI